MTGPAGIAGAQGKPGPAGPQGEKGEKGERGPEASSVSRPEPSPSPDLFEPIPEPSPSPSPEVDDIGDAEQVSNDFPIIEVGSLLGVLLAVLLWIRRRALWRWMRSLTGRDATAPVDSGTAVDRTDD
ncbi:hypothetical protein ACQP1V_43230 (plasmid) [Microtetraspora malaysiensis]|uniref:hypothetical protein n=1 Tax=Microtetraspora malaysiensis TaxID=161358 RepID=UPI003D8E6378